MFANYLPDLLAALTTRMAVSSLGAGGRGSSRFSRARFPAFASRRPHDLQCRWPHRPAPRTSRRRTRASSISGVPSPLPAAPFPPFGHGLPGRAPATTSSLTRPVSQALARRPRRPARPHRRHSVEEALKLDGVRLKEFSPGRACWRGVLASAGRQASSTCSMATAPAEMAQARARGLRGLDAAGHRSLKDDLDNVAALTCHALDLVLWRRPAPPATSPQPAGRPSGSSPTRSAGRGSAPRACPGTRRPACSAPEHFGQWDKVMAEVAEALAGWAASDFPGGGKTPCCNGLQRATWPAYDRECGRITRPLCGRRRGRAGGMNGSAVSKARPTTSPPRIPRSRSTPPSRWSARC